MSGERTVFVPITLCRLLDTRRGSDNVGQRQAPVHNNETFIATVRGPNGNCDLPPGAVGVSMNVTAVDPSASSFLVVFPSDGVRGPGSDLNWTAGQAPVPNAVTTKLSADGKIAFYNLSGDVDVIADINGYDEDHNFDDRYSTKAEVDARVADEHVVSAGITVPATLTPETVYTTFNETVTTTTSGRWLVTKSISVRHDCTSGGSSSLYYLLVDGCRCARARCSATSMRTGSSCRWHSSARRLQPWPPARTPSASARSASSAPSSSTASTPCRSPR